MSEPTFTLYRIQSKPSFDAPQWHDELRLYATRDAADSASMHVLCYAGAVQVVELPLTGLRLIATERARQMTEEGYTPEHDAGNSGGQLLGAARAYVHAADRDLDSADRSWPWVQASFRPSDDPIRNLVRAGALIAAEIDRRLAEGGCS